jgi:hypothetical protein
MGRFKYALAACSALVLGTAAQAATVEVAPSASTDITFSDHSYNQPAGSGTMSGGSGGLYYTSTYSVSSSEISFESGNVASGRQVQTTSTSRIDMSIFNGSDGQLAPAFKSQITAAGMGFYLGDNSAGTCFTSPTSCGQTHTFDTFSSLAAANPSFSGGTRTLGGVSVDFTIQQTLNGVIRPLGEFNGGLTISVNADGVDITRDLGGLSPFLQGFTFDGLTQFGHPDSALGYAWDATDIIAGLFPIGSGQSSTLSYIVTVKTFSNANCLSDDTCLLAYAGFGDPIGRGGAISSAALTRFGGFNFSGPTPNYKFINGVNFSPFTFAPPVFDSDGNLVLTGGGGGVPEPATWALTIMGFGVVGGALRRRRVPAYT